jgi:RimJ/RimL family protein N-acetyltransferase
MRDFDVVLDDGGTIHLRSVEPTDAPGIVAMHSRFSERTRYLRFFGAYPRIPARDLHRFANVDHRDREAFVATVDGHVIAIGRYERLVPHGTAAEVAFVVEDAHQGRGIAPVLLNALAVAAREAGITQFVAEVMPGNLAMMRVFADAGYAVRSDYADGVVHVRFAIDSIDGGNEGGSAGVAGAETP